MSKLKKINAFVALFSVIIMLSSTLSVFAGSGEQSTTDSTQEINATNIDVKVQKIKENDQGSNAWFDDINVFVGDTVRVKVTVSNLVEQDLVNIEVINRLPPSDYFTCITDPTFGGDSDGTSSENILIWEISELKSGESVSFEFDLKAIRETDINGVVNYANASGFLDPKYYVELDSIEKNLQSKKLELDSLMVELNDKQGKLTSLISDVDALVQQKDMVEQDIAQITDLITAKEPEKIQRETDLQGINEEIATLTQDKIVKESELTNIQIAIDALLSSIELKINEFNQMGEELELEKQTLTTLQQQLTQALQNQGSIEQEIQTLENEITDLTNQINELNNQQNTIQQEITQMTSLLTIKEEELTSIQYQIDTKEDEINNQISRINQLNQELEKEQKELTELKNNLASLMSNPQGKEKEINLLKNQIQDKEILIQQKTEGIESEKNKLNENINELSNLANQRDLKENEIAQIKSQITTKETELTDIQSQINEKQNELTSRQNDLNQRETELEAKNQEITDLNNQIQNQQDTITQKTQQKQTLENEITDLTNQINQQTNQKQTIENEITQIDNQIATKESEKTQKETELETINNELQSLTNDKNTKENELTDINNQITAKQSEINTITQEINQLSAQKQQLEQEISLLSDQISAKQDELSKIKVYSEDTATLYVSKIPVPSIDVEKKIWDEKSGQWVDEITVNISDPVKFSITLSNTGDADLFGIVVTDIFPSEILQYVCTTPQYVPDVSDNYIIWNIEKLSAGEVISLELDALAIKDGTGTNVVKASGKVSPISTPDGTGAQDEVVYAEDSVTVNVKSEEQPAPPVAVDDYATVDENSLNNLIDVLANDYSSSQDIKLIVDSITEQPTNGTAVIVDNSKIAYTPNPDYFGQDSLTYEIRDAQGATDTAQVFITVKKINNPPVAVEDHVSTYANTPADFDVTANDYDVDGDQVILNSIDTNPISGSASIIDGKIRYEPNTDFVGSDSLVYNITDGNGGFASATVFIEVVKENTPPVAVDDQATVYANSTNNVINVLSNDYDEDGDTISIDSITSQPTNGSATTSGDTILYTPNEGFNGTDSFEYKITDGNGGYDTAIVNISVIEKIIVIAKPAAGHLYFRNKDRPKASGLLKLVDADAIVIGPITIKAEINETKFNAVKVDFFINDDLMNTTVEKPYNWTLKQRFFGICTIKAVAYDSEGNTISDQINVLILNFGLFTKRISDSSQ